MGKYKTLLVMSISIIFCLILFKDVNAQNDGYEGHVLYISSYNPNFITFSDQVAGIKEGLKDDIYLEIEYMDFKSVDDEEFRKFYKIIKYSLNDKENIKAVILGDDAALEFGIKYRNDLFKGFPLIYLGVQNDENIRLASELEDVYGVIEKPSIEKNLDLISELHSGKTVVAIIDEMSSESKELELFYNLASKYNNLKFEHLSSEEYSFYDFKEALNELDDNYVVLLLNQYRDKADQYAGIIEASKVIIENLKVPAYCIYDYSVDSGFIGGKVISHFEQGKKAGEITQDILDNIDPKVKVFNSEDINKNIFNYSKLKKYSINRRKLPDDSIIINGLMNTIEQNKVFIFPIVILSISLIMITVAFIMYYIKKSHYEKKLVEAKEIAESSNKAKNHLISNISHELRTPIAVIMSSNQLLELNLKDSSYNKNKDSINIIKQNCFRLLKLTNNIIDTAKIDTGSIELKISTVNVVSFIEEIVEYVVPYAKMKNMYIIFDTSDEEIIMSIDIRKIERVLLNLLSNAIKFSSENSVIYVNINRREDIFILSVKDEGIGIDTKDFNKIFDKFTQLDETMVRKNEGSGIGLSIVKSFVELHEGIIKVSSNGNNGTEFVVELPIKILDEYDEFDNEYFNSSLSSVNVEFSDIYF